MKQTIYEQKPTLGVIKRVTVMAEIVQTFISKTARTENRVRKRVCVCERETKGLIPNFNTQDN